MNPLNSPMWKSSKFVQWAIGVTIFVLIFLVEYIPIFEVFIDGMDAQNALMRFNMRMELIEKLMYALFGGTAIYGGLREYGKNSKVAVMETEARLAEKEPFEIPKNFTGIHIDRTYEPLVTLGSAKLYVNGILKYSFLTVELPWRDNRVKVSCIPTGIYEAVKEHSPKFERDLIELKGVVGRSEVKIHPANYSRQLEGCIAPGLYHRDLDGDGTTDVTNSQETEKVVFDMLPDRCQVIITGEPK